MPEVVTVKLAGGGQRTGSRGWAERYLTLHPDAQLEEAAAPNPVDEVAERFPEVPQPVLDALLAAGFSNRQAIDQASDDDLLAVEGLGPATLAKLRAGKAEG